jgi:hypothetical protein
MARAYTGDISGHFWSGIQRSDDPTFFGRDPECIFEGESEKPVKLYYEFEFSDRDKVQSAIHLLEELIGDDANRLWFILSRPAYSVGLTADELGVSEERALFLIKNYVRLSLGFEILSCLIRKGECCFHADL